MRMLLAVIGLSGLVSGAAQAQLAVTDHTEACRAEAHRQTLSGEALADFMQKCLAGQVSFAPTPVDPQQACAAAAKLLSGEEKVKADRACYGK